MEEIFFIFIPVEVAVGALPESPGQLIFPMHGPSLHLAGTAVLPEAARAIRAPCAPAEVLSAPPGSSLTQ